MQNQQINRPDLPPHYFYLDTAESEHLHQELQRELPIGHLLSGVAVETWAADELNLDVLFRHIDAPERFTLIHLTWIGKTEIDANHPAVEFDGTFAEFLEREWRLYGLKPESR